MVPTCTRSEHLITVYDGVADMQGYCGGADQPRATQPRRRKPQDSRSSSTSTSVSTDLQTSPPPTTHTPTPTPTHTAPGLSNMGALLSLPFLALPGLYTVGSFALSCCGAAACSALCSACGKCNSRYVPLAQTAGLFNTKLTCPPALPRGSRTP